MAEIEYKCSDCVYNNLPVDYYNFPCSDCTNIDLKWRPKETKMKDFTQKEAKEYEQSLDKLYKPLNYDKHYADTAHQPIEVMQANMTLDEFVGFLKGNIIKYACRLGKKDEPEKEAAKIRRYAEWLEQVVNGKTIDPRK